MVLERVREVEFGLEISSMVVDEMVDCISTQIDTLDPRRRYMLIEWLCAHTSRVQCVINFREGLNGWFDAMPAECAIWEYRTITSEIDWWRGQDDNAIDRLILEHLRRHK